MVRLYLQAVQIMMREWEPLLLLTLLYAILSYLLASPLFPVLNEAIQTNNPGILLQFFAGNPVQIAGLFAASALLVSLFYLVWARLWCIGRDAVFSGGAALTLRRAGRIMVRYFGMIVWFFAGALILLLLYLILSALSSVLSNISPALSNGMLILMSLAAIVVLLSMAFYLAIALGACVMLEAQDRRAPLAEMLLQLKPYAARAGLSALLFFLPVYLISLLPTVVTGGTLPFDSIAGILVNIFSSLLLGLFSILLITAGGLLYKRQADSGDAGA